MHFVGVSMYLNESTNCGNYFYVYVYYSKLTRDRTPILRGHSSHTKV